MSKQKPRKFDLTKINDTLLAIALEGIYSVSFSVEMADKVVQNDWVTYTVTVTHRQSLLSSGWQSSVSADKFEEDIIYAISHRIQVLRDKGV